MFLVYLDHLESLIHGAFAYRKCDCPVLVVLQQKIWFPPSFMKVNNVGVSAAEVKAT